MVANPSRELLATPIFVAHFLSFHGNKPPASPLSTMAPGITWLILIQFTSFKACLKGIFKGYNMGIPDLL
jgi:hypothetical protein